MNIRNFGMLIQATDDGRNINYEHIYIQNNFAPDVPDQQKNALISLNIFICAKIIPR